MNIYYTWQGKNKTIPKTFIEPSILAKKLSNLSKQDEYTQTELMYKSFFESSLSNHSKEVFSAVFLGVENFEVLGFLCVNVCFESADIDFIFIQEKERKKGLATMLFKTFLLEFKKFNGREILLEVGSENKNAITFYQKLNFNLIHTRRNYYKGNEDAFLMKKDL